MDFIISGSTDKGTVKENNQDSFNVRVMSTPIGKVAFAIVCDGMGGLAKGEVASTSVVSAFCRWTQTRLPAICESGLSNEVIRKEWTDIAVEYNEKIKLYGKKCGLASGIGTTLTAMLMTETQYFIINIGDTRAYEIASGVTVLTKDQTVVAREIELGNLTKEQAEVDSRRSVLLQCVGASESVYPDMFFGQTKPDTVYMLCSDGFRHVIDENEIYSYLNPDILTDTERMKQNSVALIELCKNRQERDNITVVTLRTFRSH